MHLGRRQFAKLSVGVLALATAACGSDDEPSPGVNQAWEDRASELESSQSSAYTANDPGPWAGKEGTHVPTITPGAEARVETMHGQTVGVPDEEDHYITTVYVKDQDGVVIHLVEFDGSEEAPTTTFTPPEGTTEMTAYSYCNLHGLWQSDGVAA